MATVVVEDIIISHAPRSVRSADSHPIVDIWVSAVCMHLNCCMVYKVIYTYQCIITCVFLYHCAIVVRDVDGTTTRIPRCTMNE